MSVESDGEAGLAAARQLHPDLVVLDWLMPRMNGLEVCRALRSDTDPSLARTPMLLLTAKAQEPDLERGFAAGATDFVAKPFSTRDAAERAPRRRFRHPCRVDRVCPGRPTDHDHGTAVGVSVSAQAPDAAAVNAAASSAAMSTAA
jgi:CheY-like chemotaxis protein